MNSFRSKDVNGLITRAEIAYSRGRLSAAIFSHLKPYAIGSLLSLTPRRRSIRIEIPKYQKPSTADDDLISRLWNALQRMKRDESRAATVYRPAPFWERLISSYPVSSITDLRSFLTNFAIWKRELGIVDGRLQKLAATSIGRRYCEDILFGRQLDLWERTHKDLSQLTYPAYGNQPGAIIDGHFVGLCSFDNHHYGTVLNSAIKDIDSPIIGELGAGSCKLAFFILRELKHFTYVDFDLPEVLIVGAYYLMKSFPGKRTLLYGEAKFDGDPSGFEMIFMPPWAICTLEDKSVDLFLNKNSLGEMKRQTASVYLNLIGRSAKRFFHINHERYPQEADEGLSASEYSLPDHLKLSWKQRDPWNVIFQGHDSDIFAYLYERA